MCPRKDKGAFHHDLRHAGTGADPCSARVKGLHDVVVIRCIPVIGIAGIDGDAAGRLEHLFIDLMGSEVVAGINLPDVDPFPFVASPVQTVEILQRAGNDEKILPRPKRRIDVFVAVGIMVFDCCFVQAFRPVAPCLSVVGAALDGFVVEESVELAGIGETLDDFRRGFLRKFLPGFSAVLDGKIRVRSGSARNSTSSESGSRGKDVSDRSGRTGDRSDSERLSRECSMSFRCRNFSEHRS